MSSDGVNAVQWGNFEEPKGAHLEVSCGRFGSLNGV